MPLGSRTEPALAMEATTAAQIGGSTFFLAATGEDPHGEITALLRAAPWARASASGPVGGDPKA